jgi:hypothetical protein
MQGLISDAVFHGPFCRLISILGSEEWLPFWAPLALKVADFSDLGLEHSASDRLVWERCQELELILITANRNHDDEDSLDAVIRSGGEDALPVFTVGDKDRILRDGVYALTVATDLLDYLTTLFDTPDALLGVGRIFLPKNPV